MLLTQVSRFFNLPIWAWRRDVALPRAVARERYMEGGPVQPWWHFTRERRENQARYDALLSGGSVTKRVAAVAASRVRAHKPKS
jgi:hypothetical protein